MEDKNIDFIKELQEVLSKYGYDSFTLTVEPLNGRVITSIEGKKKGDPIA